MINEKEMGVFSTLADAHFLSSESRGSRMGEGAVFKMQSKRKMKRTNYSAASKPV